MSDKHCTIPPICPCINDLALEDTENSYNYLNTFTIDLNVLRGMVVALQKDGFSEIGLGDLLLHLKAAQKEKNA
jgi:hypothetical protein